MRLRWLHRTTLLCAAVLAPQAQRSEWLAGWLSELWYVTRSVRREDHPGTRQLSTALVGSLRSQRTVFTFCAGSFRDALSLRREAGAPRRKALHASDGVPVPAATRCVLALTLIATASCGVALLLPQVRRAVATPYPHARNLFLITPSGRAESATPAIRLSDFRLWRARRQHLFTDFAFYQLAVKPVHIAPHTIPEITVARSTPNLFDLLGVPVDIAPDASSPQQPRLILSEHLWRDGFNANPHVIGRSVKVGLRDVLLAGILPDAAWQLPGRIDAWLLEPDLDALSPNTRGFVLTRLLPTEEHADFGGQWGFSIPQPDGSSSFFECISPSLLAPQPFRIFLFTFFLALLSLPAITSLSLGEYPAHAHPLTTLARLRRWLFLAAKLALIVPAVYFASLDLAYLLPQLSPIRSEYIQIVASYVLSLFALHWAVRDQRRRCPVCLSTLSNPARVGQASRNFLDWNGTELICSGGHGLLHVPELPTSWFHTQRWLYLDASWSSLFSP